ncbi:MAG: amidohydrolase [Dehalococcoidia bacterium]|nr:amidohydrolase [Dehalococcoidia bacterium]
MSRAADLILHNANVITLDESRPQARAVAVAGNRITAVGTDSEVLSLRGPKTEAIDCHGGAVVPGFNDAHCHPIALAASMLAVDCGPGAVRSIADIQQAIRQRASQTPKGHWIRATGYNEFYLTERRHPNRRDLDAAAPEHPVKLSHRSGHACVLNSRAMEMLHISAETEEPEGGMMERDLDTGEPNGLLFEMNTYVDARMPPLTEEELEGGIRLANDAFLANGITSLQDATWNNSAGRWHLFCRLKQRRLLLPRLSVMTGADALEERRSFSYGGAADDLRLGAIKVVLQTATGSLSPPQPELDQLALKVHRAGLQLAFHVDERETLEAALTALERCLRESPQPNHRHRLEHCSVSPPHLTQRIKKTGAVVVTQPPFLHYSGERYLATVPPDDLQWLYAIGSLKASGITVAASSDAPVVPFNPLVGICAAVTRQAASGQVLLPHESISALEALRSYTIDAAYAAFEENAKGSISPGKLADLVVLSDAPTAVPPEHIKDIQVLATILDGKVVWQR